MSENETFGAPKISQQARLKYLLNRKEEISQCRLALEEGRWEIIKRAGHRIKGNAETFGMAALAPLGAELEVSANKKQKQEAKDFLDQLGKAVTVALSELSSTFSESSP